MTQVPDALNAVVGPVEKRLQEVLQEQTDRWVQIDAQLEEPLNILRSFVVGGGKRLRPAFCYWAFIGAGGEPEDIQIWNAGAAFELLHAFALIHDDVMDGSHSRRNNETVHTYFTGQHEVRNYKGESRRFGDGLAILIGDLAEVFADALMTSSNADAFQVWNELKIELNIGQFLDVMGAATGNVDLEAARQIVRYKSGKYTIERPLHLGTAMAGKATTYESALSAYGAPLGDAFQLRDDILGIFGEPERTGKPVGDDLREGKPTPLFAFARQHADAAQQKKLQRIGETDISAEEIFDLQTVFIETGAVAATEKLIDELTAQAIAAIDAIDFTPAAKNALQELAIYVGERDL